MANNTMSILFASDSEGHLNELTIHRTTASVPYGGRYRFIDFALSNLVNGGVTTIGVVTRSNYNSLMDHIRMGRDWNLSRKYGGLTVFPPYGLSTLHEVYRGKIEALYSLRNFISSKKEEYIIVSNANIVCNVDLESIIDEHIAAGTDITVFTYLTDEINSRRTIITADADGRITDLRFAVGSDKREQLVNMQIYLCKKDLLLNLVENAYARGYVDFEKDILLNKLDSLDIRSRRIDSYVATIDDITGYYKHSMDLLDADVRNELFYSHGSILTKVKDSVPTRYLENAKVKNSLIADGCEIDGTVENSILFRGVKVAKGAKVINSIVMEKGEIMENAEIKYTITDKNVKVQKERRLAGYESYPIVIVKDKIV